MTVMGTCELEYAGARRRAVISFDLQEAQINVRFAADSGIVFAVTRPAKPKFHTIDNIHIGLPNGAIRNGRIAGLIEVSSSGHSAVNNSDLVAALGISDKAHSGQKVLLFVPRQSIVRLPVAGFSGKELAFGKNRLNLNGPGLKFRIGRFHAQLFNDTAASAVVHGSADLLALRETIRRALGLVQGGKLVYRAGFAGHMLEINFVRDSSVRPLGRIYEQDELLTEFLERYIAYERKLNGPEQRRNRLAVSYILDGCAGLPSLEQKVISLFTAVEILDGARTLSADPVAKLLSLNRQQAKTLVIVRNKIVHEGLGLAQAIAEAKRLSVAHRRVSKLPFRVTGISRTRAAANLHFFLASALISTIASRIGMSAKPTSYLKFYNG